LGAVPDGDAKDYLIKSGLGLICRPNDDKKMAEHIINVYNAWKRQVPIVIPNKRFITLFERKRLTEKLAQVMKRHIAR